MKQRYVVLDLETTGNSPKKQDRIIQVGAVLIEDGEIVERFASFVNPECNIPPFIEQLTNINNEMVGMAPTFQQIAPMLNEMLEGSSLVAHNVPFDLSFLQHELKESGLPIFSGNTIDTVELARILLPTQNSYKLTDLALFYELDHENPHRADSDAEATAIIFLKLLDKIKKLPNRTINQLKRLLHNMKSDIYILFEENPNGTDKGFFVYQDKIVLKHTASISTNQKEEVRERVLRRLQQRRTMENEQAAVEVEKLFETRQHGLLEIMSLGRRDDHYIYGALKFALEQKKKVVISTLSIETKIAITTFLSNLFQNDTNPSFLLAAIKGKYYYLSLPRFLYALQDEDDNYDAVLTKAQVLVWLTETESGDMEELSLSSGGRLLWDSINCAYASNGDKDDYCFYNMAYEKMEDASLILTNHTFLAKEIWKTKVLKTIEYFVVDDANFFPANVTRFLGKEISYLDIYFMLTKIKDTKIVQQAKEELDDTFRILRAYCVSRTKSSQTRASYRYDVLKEKSPAWFAVQEAAQRLYMKLTDVLNMLEKEQIASVNTFQKDGSKALVQQQEISLLQKMRDTFYSLLFEPNKSRLTWLEVNVRGAKNSVTLYEQPLDISQSLAEKFYQQKSSVVFVSQALSVNQNFDYYLEELGLTDFYPKTLTISYPAEKDFPGLYIPTDMPTISRGKNETFIQMAALQIREILAEKGGRILVSFSSLDMLSAVYHQIKNLPYSEETVVVSQSSISGGKQKILKAAANFDKAILLVTNSFLEEVSIKKEAIDTLVIIRLPFKAMDEPVMAAKIDHVEKQGRNSFTDVSLPIAVLRYKKMIDNFLEGEGPKDVFIFDRRIIDKRYGDIFLRSIPNTIVKKDSFFSILGSMN